MIRKFILLISFVLPLMLLAQSPGGVSTPVVWYRADASVYSNAGTIPATDNASIQQWNNYMGTGQNLIQATLGSRPVYSNLTTLANFNPTVTFTRTNNHWMQCDPGTGNEIINRASGTFYSAGYMNIDYLGTGLGTGIIGFNADMDYPGLHTSNNTLFNLLMYAENGTNYSPISTNSFIYQNSFVAGASWQNGASITNPTNYGATTISLNGVHTFYSGDNFRNVNTTNTARVFRIGGDTDWGYHNGQLNEILIFQNILTAQETNRLESYLAIKYGTTLSGNYVNSTNAVVWNTSATYQKNILGIARDDNGALHQKQSRSSNLNQKLIIGNGSSLFNTNAANTNTLTDGQFLLVGDNGLKQSLTTPLSYTSGSNGETNFRFEAVWKVQNTNGVGTVTVAWPKGIQNLYLVQSSDETFASGDTFTPMTTEVTLNGVVYNTATVTLGDGQFFTFAGFEYAPGGVTGTDFWVKSDDAGTIATAWKDHSINADDIPNEGGVTFSPADRAHNFHPYTTGYTSTKLFQNTASVLNPTNLQLDNISHSIFSAVRPITAGTGRITGIDDDLARGAQPGFSIENGQLRFYKFSGGANADQFTEEPFKVGATNVVSGIGNNPTSAGGTSTSVGGERVLGMNGVYKTYPNTDAGNRFHLYGQRLVVGYGTFTAAGAFPGDIMEVIWYKRPLTANEQSRVNSYLAIKNGTTLAENYLATNSDVVWDRTINNGYNNNIFGISRDNSSALHQKQAASTGVNQKLVIGHGSSLFESNADNTNTLTEGQFLLSGDNGLKQSLSIPFVYTSGSNGETNFRFESVWKVQNTNSVGTVTVAWPKGVNNLYLVQSADQTFATGNTYRPMATEVTINGVVYNTTTATLAGGQFFTFAGFMYAPGGVTSAAWYRADAVSTLFSDAGTTVATDNATIQQWNEFNNKPFPLSQSNATLRPQFSNATTLVNFNPTANYTAANKWLQYDGNTLGNIIDRSKGALFSAGNTTGTTAFFGFGVSGASNTMDDPGLYNYLGNKFLFYPVIGEYDPQSTYTVNGSYIGGGTWQNGAGASGNNAVDITLNGFHQTYNSGILNVNTAVDRNALMAGGAETSVAFQQNEMIVFPDKLTDTEVNKVESYLAIKYGQTLSKEQSRNYLSSTGATVWNGTANTIYYNNILGIARDNVSALYQKQSRSVNAGQKLIIGAGTSLANTNATNTNTLTDGQFLLTGDNGMKQNLTTPLSYTLGSNGEVNFRFESVWKVQNTNSVGTITVAWPKGVNNLYLVQSADQTFATGNTYTPMATEVTINGVVYNTTTATLADGQFFTFAGFMYAPGGVTSAAWYRADAAGTLFSDAGTTVASDNATIQQWNEFNNKPFPLSQSNATYRPQFSNATTLVNFNPTATYTGGEKWLQYAPADAQGYILDRSKGALFSAGNTTGTAALFGFGEAGSGNAMDDPGLYSFTGNKFLFYPVVGEYDPQSTYTINGPYIGGGTWQNGAGGNNAVDITLDGFHQTYNTGINNVNLATTRNALMVGKADAGAQLVGQQNEMIVFPNKLTDVEVNKVESYLAIKYGKTLSKEQSRNYLSSTGATVWDGTANTIYYNNVLGIARDNVSALHQKQSKSVNANQKLVIGNGSSLFNTNAANTNALTEGQFLLTGDNGLRQSLTTPLSYTSGSNGVTNLRFESVWKVQNSGNVGTVTVAWPKGVSNLYLVQSADQTFATGNTFTPMATEVTINGVVYNTTTATLANGQFFTFAGFAHSPGGVTSGLSYWYRADKNAANTGATTDVTGWTDMWNGTTVGQLGTNALPKYVLGTSDYFNFNPGVNFTAGNQTLGNVSVRTFSADSYDVFTFTKELMTSGGAFSSIFRSLVDNAFLTGGIRRWDGLGIQMDNGIERLSNTGGSTDTGVFASPGAFSGTIPSIMYHTFTANSTTRALNGDANFGTTNHGGTGVRNLNGGHLFGDSQFGGNGSDNRGFIGHLGETIIYGAGNLTATERRRVDSYLAIKYGITLGQVATNHYLDTDGSIVWNGTSNPTYNSNIFGVSRDDIEDFEQKVSKSVNAGTILTVATINDFVNPNEDAARTGFANDKTYFLLGDNNVTATPLVDITVAGNTWKRIQRIWLSQRKNTPDALYFGANLSAYGSNFGAGSTVWMLVADDDAFTTNVQSVAGTFTNGKWVFSNNFNADNVQRYITFAGLAPNYCFTGDCNPNTFLNTSDPNTIEYDNMVSTFHSSRMRDAATGALMVWGERMANNGSGSVLSPVEVNNVNYPALSGKVLKFTGGSAGQNIVQSILLTTTGLFAWGQEGVVISANITSNTTLEKLSIGTFGVSGGAVKIDGLPAGVAPEDVKMLYGNLRTLALTTCSGEVWMLGQHENLYGDGATRSTANDMLWHRVRIDAATTLDNVVAVRGGTEVLMALTATGEVYTWGRTFTRLGDGTGAANRPLATQMTLPVGVTPKMIGMGASTYFLLGSNGNVYSMGGNNNRELGIFSAVSSSNLWVQVQKSATAGDYLTNVVWISPNEHESTSFGTINVLTANGRLWAWGSNSFSMIGGTVDPMDPTEMPGSIPSTNPYNIGKLNWTDKVIAVETGGHTSMIVKDNSKKYGYVGHRISGSMGDGTATDFVETTYNFADTPEIDLCGTEVHECPNPSGTDSDGDGIDDSCDLDDDNDGILDTAECPTSYDDFIVEYGAGATTSILPSDFGLALNVKNQNVTRDLSAKFGFPANSGAVVVSITNASVHPTSNVWWTKNGQQPSIWQVTGTVSAFVGMAHDLQYYANDSKTIHIYDNANVIPVTVAGNANQTAVPGQWSITDTQSQKTLNNLNASSATIEIGNWRYINMNFGPKSFGFSTTVASGEPNYEVFMLLECDTDGDGIPNRLDLDSDNDGCLDALEGDGGFAASDLETAGGTVTVGFGSGAPDENLCGDGTCVDENGIPTAAGTGQGIGSSQDASISNCLCYKPGLLTGGSILDTNIGITSLSRAGADNPDNWPMVRKGGWIALESKTKGFVPNRVEFTDADTDPLTPDTPVGIPLADFVEGMMVYDNTNKCMKMYTSTDGGTTYAWYCITSQTCPD